MDMDKEAKRLDHSEIEDIFGNDFNFTHIDPKIVVPDDLEPLRYSSAVLGYRAWRIFTDEDILQEKYHDLEVFFSPFSVSSFTPASSDYLYPMIQDEYWNPYDDISECYNTNSDHQVPGVNCHCGWNAFKDFDRALEYKKGLGFIKGHEPRVIVGSIAGSGRVELHADGWRSEKAVILGLCNLPEMNNFDEHIQSISEFYNIPVFDNEQDLGDHSLQYASTPEEVEIYPEADF